MSLHVVTIGRRIGRFLHDGWLILGIVLLMLLALELAYRGQAALRTAVRSRRPDHQIRPPYADSAWYPTYRREFDRASRMRWKSYVYFRRRPFAGSLVNVDSLGLRRTIPGPRSAADTVRVFFLGGSTTWGTDQRDWATIPSEAARRLAETAPQGTTYDVTNFGESGYVFTQEILELEFQLRDGNIPDVVVFYDGINDIGAAAQQGETGIPQNEANRSREFELGRAVYGWESGLAGEWRAARALASVVALRLQVVRRALAALAPQAQPARDTKELARDVARVYAGGTDIVEALSRTYGFRALYVWQPSPYTTRKRATAFEEALLAEIANTDFQQRLRTMHRVVLPALDSAMRGRVGGRFVDATALFDGDSSSVFTDNIGHNTEKSIPRIVDGFYSILVSLVDSVRADGKVARRNRR